MEGVFNAKQALEHLLDTDYIGPVPTHSDAPAIKDKLDRLPFAEVIAKRIDSMWSDMNQENTGNGDSKNSNRDKFVVHIHGPWGSGKTSILNMIGDTLKNGKTIYGVLKDGQIKRNLNNHWVVIKFNAWEHQRIKPPW